MTNEINQSVIISRVHQLAALCDAVEKESIDFKNRYGFDSALTRISAERFLKLREMLTFITGKGQTVMDYWLKEYGIDGGEN